MPLYRFELAKSGRSRCSRTGKFKFCGADASIGLGEVRVGSLDGLGSALEGQAGTYTKWNHLKCWRVPNKVWLGLPGRSGSMSGEEPMAEVTDELVASVEDALHAMDQVIVSGFGDLPAEARKLVARHAAQPVHWTRQVKRSKQPRGLVERRWVAPGQDPGASSLDPTVVPAAQGRRESPRLAALPRFVPPRPGGAQGGPPNALAGEVVVLTGTFPELGGGAGLALGKARCREMVETFGGAVRSKVSGRTTLVVVGKDPGRKTVDGARARGRARLVTLAALKRALERGDGGFVLEGPGVEAASQAHAATGALPGGGGSSSQMVERLAIPRYSKGFVTTKSKQAKGLLTPERHGKRTGRRAAKSRQGPREFPQAQGKRKAEERAPAPKRPRQATDG